MLGVSAVGAGISAYSAQRQYKAQKSAYGQNSGLIEQQYQQDLTDMRGAQEVVTADTTTAMSERVLGMESDLATIRTISGEFGAGNNSKRIEFAARQDAGEDLSTIELNRGRQMAEIGKDANAARNRKARELASLQKPDRVGRNLAIAGSALEVANAWNKYRTPAPKMGSASYGVLDMSVARK